MLGTGGAARALAFGAAERGADVLVAGRNVHKAEALAAQVGQAFGGGLTVSGVALQDVQSGGVSRMDVLLNTTPLGMVGERVDDTPVPSSVLEQVRHGPHSPANMLARYVGLCAMSPLEHTLAGLTSQRVGHTQLLYVMTRGQFCARQGNLALRPQVSS